MEDINKEIGIVKLLKQVMKAIKNTVSEDFKEMNLTGPQGMLIKILHHHGEMKISDLSHKLGLSNSTVSGIVDRLEKQGIVERTRSKEDRRVVHVNVTSDFTKSVNEHFNKVEKKFGDIIDKATPEEIEKITEGLAILKKLIDKQNEQNK